MTTREKTERILVMTISTVNPCAYTVTFINLMRSRSPSIMNVCTVKALISMMNLSELGAKQLEGHSLVRYRVHVELCDSTSRLLQLEVQLGAPGQVHLQ